MVHVAEDQVGLAFGPFLSLTDQPGRKPLAWAIQSPKPSMKDDK